MIIKLGDLLGRGGYGNVYRALDPEKSTPLPIAIKKSRASQRIRRPHLEHEVRVLYLLRGHPVIPRVFAYGHLKHFEYMAMELLGKSLQELMPKDGMKERTVATIAVHLISALEFIHSHGLIHRDIKPPNILLTLEQPPTLRLIDFGITRPFRSGVPAQSDPFEKRQTVPGTLDWVSLNAHLGYDTSRRDDLESLAYTLLFLLRGELPWQRYHAWSGTLFGDMKQIREKKRRWPGSRLGEGFAREFGELLDYARVLGFEEIPDYTMLERGFERIAGNKLDALEFPLATSTVLPPPTEPHSNPMPVSPGELIYVQILSRFSIEGYTAQASDLSHWDDTSLLGPEWETKKWPSVVLEVEAAANGIYWRVKVLPLSKNIVREKVAEDNTVIGVSPQSSESEQWTWEGTVAFGLPNTTTFRCLPDQPVLTPTQWSLPASDCAVLSQRLDRRLRSSSTSADEQLKIRIEEKMSRSMYVVLSPLEDPRLEEMSSDVAWYGARGWLDEMAKVARQRVFEQGQVWSNSERVGQVAKRDEDEADHGLTDSNSNPYTEWWPQSARDVSLTIGKEDKVSGGTELDQSIERIESVVRAYDY